MPGVLELYLLFMKFGFLCFGGGYMLMPLLSADLVKKLHYLEPEEFGNLVSIAQVTPGPIGINTATYTGFTQHGVLGGIVATLGLLTPAVLLVILAMKLLKKYNTSIIVTGFLAGMRPACCGLMLVALLVFAELSIFTAPVPVEYILGQIGLSEVVTCPEFSWRPVALIIAIAAFLLLQKTKISFLWVLLFSGIAGAFLLG